MRVRVVDHKGNLIVEGDLVDTYRQSRGPDPYKREVIYFQGHDVPYHDRARSSMEDTGRWGHATVKLESPHKMPLWYGGFYDESVLHFTLPSGLHNIWGQGNDFDTDAYRIHPDDLAGVIAKVI